MRLLYKVLFFSTILFLATVFYRAQADTETDPSLAEYKTIPEGMLLPDEQASPADAATDFFTQDDTQAGEVDAMTTEDVVAAYKKGQYDLISKRVVLLAENGQHQAEEILGVMYHNGQGVKKDVDKALVWLTKAAEAGQPLAQHHLGVIAFTGEVGPPDPVRALMWLHIAILHYPDGPEKTRAKEDRENVYAQLSRRDRDRALELARGWLDARGEGRLLELQAQ